MILLVGIVFVLVSEINLGHFSGQNNLIGPQIKGILIATGTAFIAASLTNLLIRRTQSEADTSIIRIEKSGKSPFLGHYLDRMHETDEIDLLAVLNAMPLRHLSSEQGLKDLMKNIRRGSKFRIIILDPRCDYVQIRANEAYRGDVENFKKRIRESIEQVEKIGKYFQMKFKPDFFSCGTLEVRICDRPQNIWMFRTGNEILWGFIPSYDTNTKSRALSFVKESDEEFFDQFLKHFDALWESLSSNQPEKGGCILLVHFPNDISIAEDLLKELKAT